MLCIAALLALLSVFFVYPNSGYLSYIDTKTLALLFCLMLVVAGFQSAGVFRTISETLLLKLKNTRQLGFILVFLCFFTSMLITNDVALITFVPLSIMTLSFSGQENNRIYIIVLQTIAANLGSMLTPLGNPQNLYLYTTYSIPLTEFLKITAPITALSILLLIVLTSFSKKQEIKIIPIHDTNMLKPPKAFFYLALFLICIAAVVHLLPIWVAFLVILISCLLIDPTRIKYVDYSLLFTFVFFFIFVGNMGNIPVVHKLIKQLIFGRECLTGVLLSQGISNVPTAVLLSGFTTNYKALLLGVNLGGLGTLIASMASLISYKQYVKSEHADKLKYLLIFTALNIISLAILLIGTWILYY